MGSWGSGIFENDHVMDWYCALEDETDITPNVSKALEWVVNHQSDQPAPRPRSDDKETAIAAAALDRMSKDDTVEVVNLDKPGSYFTYEREFDIGLAAAELVAASGGKPMPKGEKDILSGAEVDVASFVTGKLHLSNELITKAVQVTEIVLARKELHERWATEAAAQQWKGKVMDLRHRLQSLAATPVLS